jgi:hypothetical protein
MSLAKRLLRGAAILATVVTIASIAGGAAPVGATTLVRADLDKLAAENAAVVLGRVEAVRSYWNAEGTFILTDVRLATLEVIKGALQKGRDLEITLMGGTVGDLTTLIIGGPRLVPGHTYVLFLNEEDLPGAPGALTVRDLVQGAFDVVMTKNGLRAISQANGHPLVPDAAGSMDVPGSVEGLELDSMIRSIGTGGRTLESDDNAALQLSESRY